MAVSHTPLRSVFTRLALTSCIVAPLAAIALVTSLDAALARGDGSNGVKPVLSKREHEVKVPRKLDRCIEHGGCSGVIRTVGSPKPLQPYPVGFPIGARPPTGGGGTATGAGGAAGTSGSGGSPIDDGGATIQQF
jgi:hypothetical protein